MAEPLRLLAAGGLERSLADIDWGPDLAVQAQLGPSGFWCRAIETGERWNVFASADAGHPARLHAGAWPRRPEPSATMPCAYECARGLEPDAPLTLLG